MLFQKLKDLNHDFPFEDQQKPQSTFILIKDTLFTNGNFAISQLLSSYLKQQDGVSFIGISQQYAHYSNCIKRMGMNLNQYIIKEQLSYINLYSSANDWIPQDLPFTEETHNSWVEPPSNVFKIQLNEQKELEFFQKIYGYIKYQLEKQQGNPAIIIDNLTCLFDIIQNKGNIYTFITNLIYLTKNHPKKPSLYILSTCTFDLELQKLLGVIESYADCQIELFENTSGYQIDISGQMIIKVNKNNKIQKYLYALSENMVEIKNSYNV